MGVHYLAYLISLRTIMKQKKHKTGRNFASIATLSGEKLRVIKLVSTFTDYIILKKKRIPGEVLFDMDTLRKSLIRSNNLSLLGENCGTSEYPADNHKL